MAIRILKKYVVVQDWQTASILFHLQYYFPAFNMTFNLGPNFTNNLSILEKNIFRPLQWHSWPVHPICRYPGTLNPLYMLKWIFSALFNSIHARSYLHVSWITFISTILFPYLRLLTPRPSSSTYIIVCRLRRCTFGKVILCLGSPL